MYLYTLVFAFLYDRFLDIRWLSHRVYGFITLILLSNFFPKSVPIYNATNIVGECLFSIPLLTLGHIKFLSTDFIDS